MKRTERKVCKNKERKENEVKGREMKEKKRNGNKQRKEMETQGKEREQKAKHAYQRK